MISIGEIYIISSISYNSQIIETNNNKEKIKLILKKYNKFFLNYFTHHVQNTHFNQKQNIQMIKIFIY